MDPSISDIAIIGARDMLMMWAIGSVVLRVLPDVPKVADKITLGKKVLSFIGEAPEWVNFEKNLEENIQSLKDMMSDLLCVEEDVRQELEISEFQNNKKRKREVVAWLKNVKSKSGEVTKLEKEMRETRAFSKFLFRAWLGSCVEKKMKEVTLLRDQQVAFKDQLVIDAHCVGRERLLSEKLVGLVASQSKEEIWGHLKSQGVTIIGIEGDQGIGKSIMMLHIHDRILDEPSLFDCAFYVNIKEENDVYQLQTAIGMGLKLKNLDDEDCEIRRAARIGSSLKKAKRFVLILDGLMSPFELHKVGIPLQGGGKVVVVAHARSQRVCQRMSCRPIVRVNTMPFEDARELFKETLRPSGDLSLEIEGIVDEIVRLCNGVPRRIIEVSESLRGMDYVSDWKRVEQDLRQM